MATRSEALLNKRKQDALKKKEEQYKKYKIKEGGAFSRDEKLALAKKNAQRKADPKAYAKRKAAHEASAEKKRLGAAKTKHDDFQKKHKRGKYSDKNVAKAAEKEKIDTLFGMSQQRLGAANAAREQARQAIIGGVGDMVSGAAGMGGVQNALKGNFITDAGA